MSKIAKPGRKKAEIDPASVLTVDQIFPSELPDGWFDDDPGEDQRNPLFADATPELRLKLQDCFCEVIEALGSAAGYALITAEVDKLGKPKASPGRPGNENAFLVELDNADRSASEGQKAAACREVCERYGKTAAAGMQALKRYRAAQRKRWQKVTGAKFDK